MIQVLVNYTPGSSPLVQNKALSRFLSTLSREVVAITNDTANSCWVVEHK